MVFWEKAKGESKKTPKMCNIPNEKLKDFDLKINEFSIYRQISTTIVPKISKFIKKLKIAPTISNTSRMKTLILSYLSHKLYGFPNITINLRSTVKISYLDQSFNYEKLLASIMSTSTTMSSLCVQLVPVKHHCYLSDTFQEKYQNRFVLILSPNHLQTHIIL